MMKKQNEVMNIVIIGGVATGPRAAARLKRLLPEANITLVNESSKLSYGACGLPYFASGDISDINELYKTSFGIIRDEEYFRDTKGFSVLTPYRAENINRIEKVVHVTQVENGEKSSLEYDYLVIATGASPIRLDIPGAESDRVRTFSRPDDASYYRKLAETGQLGSVCIVGAGFIGCELCESFTALWGIETTVIEKEAHVLPTILDEEMAALVQAEMIKNGVTVKCGATVAGFDEGNDSVTVNLGGETLSVDQVVMAVGFTPNSVLAKDCGLIIGETGGISVNDHLQTSEPSIYAGGDCVESYHRILNRGVFIPLGSIANRHGRLIANNIAGREDTFPGAVGSLVVKIFDINVAATGITEKCAKENNINASCVWGSFIDKAEYYPEWEYVYCKMVYERDSGRLLGLQAVGPGDVTRRVDIFAQLLHQSATLDDLLDIEAAYSPPYATALDPLYVLGCIAKNQEEDSINAVNPEFLAESDFGDVNLIDVREDEEREAEPLKVRNANLVEIKLGDLRTRASDLRSESKAMVVCHRGVRGYEGARILKNAGYENVAYLGGGVSFVNAMKGEEE
ncbi:MAG: pyridine nucleotide-disulfide oxidoreductase [candidate division Zixibacteria bacterium]|nr:pyridine nucleotide-disulfide oxidoreductase [candidate division Zixibacteria bacterium]